MKEGIDGKVIYRKNYLAYPWDIKQLDLHFDVGVESTTVRAQMEYGFGGSVERSVDAEVLIDERLRQAASRARCTFVLDFPDGRVIEVIHQPLRAAALLKPSRT